MTQDDEMEKIKVLERKNSGLHKAIREVLVSCTMIDDQFNVDHDVFLPNATKDMLKDVLKGK